MPDGADTLHREFTAREFCNGLLSGVLLSGQTYIQPREPAAREGFSCLMDVLNAAATRAGTETDRAWHKQVVRLRNALQPDNNGVYAEMERLLRESPQATQGGIALRITTCPSFARATLDTLGAREQDIVEKSVRAFRMKGGMT